MAKVVNLVPKKEIAGRGIDREFEEVIDMCLESFPVGLRPIIKKEIMVIQSAYDHIVVPFDHSEKFTPEQLRLVDNYKYEVIRAVYDRTYWIAVELILRKLNVFLSYS